MPARGRGASRSGTGGAVAEQLSRLDGAERERQSADASIYSSDRLHLNARGHAIAATAAIRELAAVCARGGVA